MCTRFTNHLIINVFKIIMHRLFQITWKTFPKWRMKIRDKRFTFPRQTLKRVKYLQMSNYQLFKKIQLASDHVRTPLKSELNFYKPLILNDLAKFDSLQTLSVYFSPDSQLSFL